MLSILLLSSTAPCDHSFNKAQKNLHGSFEVKRGSRKHDIDEASEETLAEVPPWPLVRLAVPYNRLYCRLLWRTLVGSPEKPLPVEDDAAVVGRIQCDDVLSCHGCYMLIGFERHNETTPHGENSRPSLLVGNEGSQNDLRLISGFLKYWRRRNSFSNGV